MSSPQIQVDLGGQSHRGKVRPTNEDCFLIGRLDRRAQVLLTNLPAHFLPDRHGETVYGFLIADGIGGGPAGSFASQSAIGALLDLLAETPDWIMQLNEETVQRVMERTAMRFRQIEEALIEQTRENPRLTGMGTTLTAAVVYGTNAVVSHVGHSRAYLFHNGNLQKLTGDHTMAHDLARAGAIQTEDVKSHPFRRILTNVISTKRGTAQAEIHQIDLVDGDQILLCTDGLTEMVAESAIAQVLAQKQPAPEACQDLIDLALNAGGKDNITVTLARCHYSG